MRDKTRIEWCDATWNPVTGCTKVSARCKFCYAEQEFPRVYPGRKFTDVVLHPERLDQPLRWKRPRKVFVVSMGDLFHGAIPWHFILKIFAVMDEARHHRFQVLTKRPQEMLAFCRGMGRNPDTFQLILSAPGALENPEILPNVWLGVSVEDQETADERIPLLLQTPAAVRLVRYEPALGQIDFSAWLCSPFPRYRAGPDADEEIKSLLAQRRNEGINWLICGGESGPYARPSHPDWFRSARDQCVAAGVPFFFKQWGNWAPTKAKPIRGKYTGSGIFLKPDGGYANQGQWWDGKAEGMDRHRNKKFAGRLLDGKEHNEFPK